jgi:glutathione S-transferase
LTIYQTAINPKGLIPAVSYQGKSIYESSIVCEFLVDAYPDSTPQLLPKDAYSRAHARIWIDYTNKYIMPAYFRLFQAKTPEMQTASLEEYTKALKVFADQVKGPYFMGEDFGLVDICICAWIVRDFVLVRHRGFSRAAVSERFESYANHLEKRESVVRTLSVRVLNMLLFFVCPIDV